MDTLDITKFDPTTEELQKIVEQAKTVFLTDLKDEEGLKLVKKMRLALRDVRVKITKKGKELREAAVKYSKAVIEHEKELVGILTPEEERLQGIEDEAEKQAEIESRKVLLPKRREELEAIKDGIEISDEAILEMDMPAFALYLNERVANKNAADRAELDRRQAEVTAAQASAIEEKIKVRSGQLYNLDLKYNGQMFFFKDINVDMVEVKTLTDQEWADLIAKITPVVAQRKREEEEKRAADLADATERGKRQAEEEAAKERQREEERAAAEKIRLEKEGGYQLWLESNAFNEETDILIDNPTGVILYRRIGSFEK